MTDLSEKAARLRELRGFLNGEGPMDYLWFGDDDEHGNSFWWRKRLSDIDAMLDHIEPTPIDEARAQFKAEMDALVRMADVSPYHNEGSRETARAMRDAAVASFDAIMRASKGVVT